MRGTDREFARFVGAVLAAANAGSSAWPTLTVAAAKEGGDVTVTGDEEDLRRLQAAYPNVVLMRI